VSREREREKERGEGERERERELATDDLLVQTRRANLRK